MRAFVDTNILVYAEDRDAGRRHEVSRELVLELWGTREGVLSVQVLQELYVNLSRKVRKPLSPAKALEVVQDYLAWEVVESTTQLLVAAAGLQQRAQLSFWDALVVQAALHGGCERLYSEDFTAGQRFGALVVVDPFDQSTH